MLSMKQNEAKAGSEALGLPEHYGIYFSPEGWLWIRKDPITKKTRRDGPWDTRTEARTDAWEDFKDQ